ncbi:MAG: DEAD/DEAH box helicase [Microthrixaceae bacterium]
MPDAPSSFADLGLRAEVLAALDALGYEEPTPIQAEAVPVVRSGRDLLAQAATGTGKTAAFALPILERIEPGEPGAPVALVLVPTRELAVQVGEAVHRYGRELGVQVLPVFGGQPVVQQLKVLRRGVHVVVATPGRAVDLVQRRALDLDSVQVVVLDEADEMLDMGFADDLDTLLEACPEGHQTVLFSATLPRRIEQVADRHLRDPVLVRIEREVAPEGEAPRVRQDAYVVGRSHKAAALCRVLDVESPTAALVFCRTRGEVDELTETLNARGYRAEALHGGMDQEQRDRVMGRLRSGTAELLVATDVAARGLDVEHLTHVVNFDLPSSTESYVHRIGRVGRAGREGVAITLVEPRRRRLLDDIERATGQSVRIVRIPTVADLRARQMELTLDQVREALEADEGDGEDGRNERFRAVLEALTDDFDVDAVALAAIRLVHEASGATDDDTEIPQPEDRHRPDRHRGDRGPRRESDRGPGRGRDAGGRGGGAGGSVGRLYVGAGRAAGVRPQDLVGAITGETNLGGRDIGAIRIFDRFSLVEVPERSVQQVISAMSGATIRGRRVQVRRDRGDHDRGGGRD